MRGSNIRTFIFSIIASLLVLLAVLFGLGPAAVFTALILVVIELTFSFDNAIVNAKVLERLSVGWQTAFLTIGIIVAVFLVRLVLPILIVQVGAGISFGDVIRLALNHPDAYAKELLHAHPVIASFGGAFLLALALDFFINGKHGVYWWQLPEKYIRKLANFWMPAALSVLVVSILAVTIPHETREILAAGWVGVAIFVVIRIINIVLERKERGTKHLAGWAGLGLFMYLQVLDASFSLDGVVGAFAISNKVLLIAAGLGIGALWVRSLTIFMVRRGTLADYKYLEHGAYYTIFVLAMSLFASLFVDIPDVVTGLAGIAIISFAVVSSISARKKHLSVS